MSVSYFCPSTNFCTSFVFIDVMSTTATFNLFYVLSVINILLCSGSSKSVCNRVQELEIALMCVCFLLCLRLPEKRRHYVIGLSERV